MKTLRLYSRPECHLCDYAVELIKETGCGIEIESIDIEQDPDLLSRYDVRIPVLLRPDTGAELCWPFDDDDIVEFLGNAVC
jgi:hypothetical protein